MNSCSLLTLTDILWQLMESNNHDPEPLFSKAGISRDSIKTAGLRVPFKIVDELWREASRIIEDPCFGLRASEFWHPAHMHALGYAWLSSRTLREALGRYKRYNRILSPISDITLEENDQGLALIVKPTPQVAPRPNRIDALFACIMKMCRTNYRNSLNMETDLTEIAFMLGFSEHSAFSRAFRRWTGRSPKETRDALLN